MLVPTLNAPIFEPTIWQHEHTDNSSFTSLSNVKTLFISNFFLINEAESLSAVIYIGECDRMFKFLTDLFVVSLLLKCKLLSIFSDLWVQLVFPLVSRSCLSY